MDSSIPTGVFEDAVNVGADSKIVMPRSCDSSIREQRESTFFVFIQGWGGRMVDVDRNESGL